MPSPVRWVGTESGLAPYPMWSTADANGGGNPAAGQWYPAETDFTLQNGDQWFYNAGAGVRAPADLRTMIETSVGHNTAVIVDIAPMPTGEVPQAQVGAAASLGTYLKACYGSPPAGSTSSSGAATVTLSLAGAAQRGVNRIMVREDVTLGELVRTFELRGIPAGGGAAVSLFNGTSIGFRFIAALPKPMDLQAVVLEVTSVDPRSRAGAPHVQELSAFACGTAAAAHDASGQ